MESLTELADLARAVGHVVSERVEAIGQGASMTTNNERDAHLYAADALTDLCREVGNVRMQTETDEDELKRQTRTLRARGRKIAYEMVMKLEDELREVGRERCVGPK
jgi:hypothetical protein